MSAGKISTETVTLYVCRFCGRVGIRTRPSAIDFGGCVPPNQAHIFAEIQVVAKPPAQAAAPAKPA